MLSEREVVRWRWTGLALVQSPRAGRLTWTLTGSHLGIVPPRSWSSSGLTPSGRADSIASAPPTPPCSPPPSVLQLCASGRLAWDWGAACTFLCSWCPSRSQSGVHCSHCPGVKPCAGPGQYRSDVTLAVLEPAAWRGSPTPTGQSRCPDGLVRLQWEVGIKRGCA